MTNPVKQIIRFTPIGAAFFYLKGFIEDIAGFLNSMNDSVTKGGEEDEGVFYYF
ncbi:hypothetical protein HNR31_003411 [Anoxybacillus caldiproteolyticus]|uniref:Uncharacterized protein n=1 Tax=Thermaerobacillus caldiproteolyticus TaxID=247480 RepID=A0A7W0C000_9BACL|nr:hypothetical protein [Anoxybacillus caldiproteolyticus]